MQGWKYFRMVWPCRTNGSCRIGQENIVVQQMVQEGEEMDGCSERIDLARNASHEDIRRMIQKEMQWKHFVYKACMNGDIGLT